MSDHFQRALDFVLKWEGGLVDHPNDPGGITNYGISQNAHPELTRDQIKNLTKEQAAEIYKKKYWLQESCDQMPWPLCLVYFDTAVNLGQKRADFFLKNSLSKFLNPYSQEICSNIIEQRISFYQKLAQRPKYHLFLKGWLNRVNDLKKVIFPLECHQSLKN